MIERIETGQRMSKIVKHNGVAYLCSEEGWARRWPGRPAMTLKIATQIYGCGQFQGKIGGCRLSDMVTKRSRKTARSTRLERKHPVLAFGGKRTPETAPPDTKRRFDMSYFRMRDGTPPCSTWPFGNAGFVVSHGRYFSWYYGVAL
jgi:hypothetical protein